MDSFGECEAVKDGIEAVRQILPKCYFDEKRCQDGIAALENYHKEWDEKRQCFKEKPCHDWSSHYSDGFRYFAVSWKEIEESSKIITVPHFSGGSWMG